MVTESNDPNQAPHLRLGRRGEELAAQYLRNEGWKIERQNFTTERGEIDIVARREIEDGAAAMVAFVEVKSRRSGDRIAPELSVTARKRRTIVRLGREYADRHGGRREGYRFDVIAVDFDEEPPSIRHFEGAFDAKGNPY